jgi:hypothetical protein
MIFNHPKVNAFQEDFSFQFFCDFFEGFDMREIKVMQRTKILNPRTCARNFFTGVILFR